MELVWILLRWLFPADPVRRCIEALKQHVAHLIDTVLNEDCLAELDRDPALRLHLESMIVNYEEGLQACIAGRACQIAGLPYTPTAQPDYTPSRARPAHELLTRLDDLARDCMRIEQLAQLRAIRLKRASDADPLGHAAHGSTDAWLRHTAHHEAVSLVRWSVALILSSARSARPSKDEGALTPARGPPPLPIVLMHPKAALQAHLRGRGRLYAPQNIELLRSPTFRAARV